MPKYERDGLSIYYESAGQGPGLLMLHANPFDHRFWLFQIIHFAADFHVVAPDFRAYGLSSQIETPYAAEELCVDILGLLDSNEIDRTIVMGASVGSRLAIQLALDHPHRVSALVLVGANSGPSPRADRRIFGFRENKSAYHEEYLRELVHSDFAESRHGRYLLGVFKHNGERLSVVALERFFAAANSIDFTPRLSEIHVPTLVINGQHDHSLEVGRRTASLIPGAMHRMIAGTGHACCLEDPQSFDDLVHKFLVSLDLAPRVPLNPSSGRAQTSS